MTRLIERTYISMKTLPFAETSLVKTEILLVYFKLVVLKRADRASSAHKRFIQTKLPAIKLIETIRR